MIWLSKTAVITLHKRAIAQYGGLEPIAIYTEKLEATLAKPQQLKHYNSKTNIAELAASYGFGFAKNHCFNDGNKRIAFYSVFTFLLVNGYKLIADEVAAAQTFENLAAGQVDESLLAEWLNHNIKKCV